MTMMRMAQAQGVLNTPKVNSVQVAASALLAREDREIDRLAYDQREWTTLRGALVGTNPKSAETLFPQFFPSGDKAAESGENLEDRIAQDEVTPDVSDEIEKFIRERGGIMTGADLGAEDEWM